MSKRDERLQWEHDGEERYLATLHGAEGERMEVRPSFVVTGAWAVWFTGAGGREYLCRCPTLEDAKREAQVWANRHAL